MFFELSRFGLLLNDCFERFENFFIHLPTTFIKCKAISIYKYKYFFYEITLYLYFQISGNGMVRVLDLRVRATLTMDSKSVVYTTSDG